MEDIPLLGLLNENLSEEQKVDIKYANKMKKRVRKRLRVMLEGNTKPKKFLRRFELTQVYKNKHVNRFPEATLREFARLVHVCEDLGIIQ